MTAGESKIYRCPGCDREFEITLEPSCVDHPKKAEGYPFRGEPVQCPFCSGNGIVCED